MPKWPVSHRPVGRLGPCSEELNRHLGRATPSRGPLSEAASLAPAFFTGLLRPTSKLQPPEAGLLARPAKVACSCDHGASHAGAAATRVSFSGFWSPSRATPPLSEPELGCQSWASSARRRPPRSTQCRLASKASTGGHEGRWKMEAQAAEPSLRAHRRPPERPEGSAAPRTQEPRGFE